MQYAKRGNLIILVAYLDDNDFMRFCREYDTGDYVLKERKRRAR